jgi:hypothetical protein
VVLFFLSAALLLAQPAAAFSIASARSQFVESAYWTDQPTLEFNIFMPTTSSRALVDFTSELNRCVAAEATGSGNDAFGLLAAPGWKASVQRQSGSDWSTTVGFGAVGSGSFEELNTEIGDLNTDSPNCVAREGGSVAPLVAGTPLEYQVVGPITESSIDPTVADCASWTTIDGEQKSTRARIEPDWLGPGVGKLTCTIDEQRPIQTISLQVGFLWHGVNADYNLAGLSSLLVLNGGQDAEIFRMSDAAGKAERVVRVAPAKFEVAVHAAPGEEIVSVAPGEMSFSVRQYATADLSPGDGTVIRSANTVIRGMTGAAEQLLWMLTGVVVGALVYATRRVGIAFEEKPSIG